MVNTIKFSQFSEAALTDATTETVGIASGVNIKTPKVVTWTTSSRPLTPFDGLLGFNTDLQQYEFWDSISNTWIQLASDVDLTSTFILETPDLGLPNSFALSTLATGILKNTTGTGVPSISAPLTSIDSLVTTANEILYTTAPNIYAVSALSPFSRGLLGDISTSAWRTDLGVPGLPVNVAQGGTGNTTFTPFAVITAGTTPTSPFQNVVGVGAAGQTLTSNGAGLLPTWQSSSGSGTVNPGLINEVAYYAANGTAVSGLLTANNGVLITGNTGIPSISSTLPSAVQLNITNLGTITTGTWNGSLISLAFGGTNANLIASNGGIVWSNASQMQILAGTPTAGQVLVSGASGSPSWSTATFPVTVGSAGTIIRSNGTNWVASTAVFADTYATNNLLYSNGANNVVGLSTSANGTLITDGAGVPSISSTLPSAVQLNITSLGTITTGVWQGSDITVPFGGTGNTSFTAYSVIVAGTTATGNFQNVVGVGTLGQVLTSQGGGALPQWTTVTGTGTVNPGLINQLAFYAAAGTVLSGLATANNGVLITSAGGIPSISSTLPSAVQGNITTVGTITSGIWQGTDIALAKGGTGATLTASLGGIVYSTASAFAILAGTATANQMLMSGAAAPPVWSTATFPSTAGASGTILRSNGTNWVNSTATFSDTYTANNILYSNGANTVTGLATANNGVLITSGTGAPSISSTLPNAVQVNITSVGTITSGVWNGTDIDVSHGGTGDSSFTAFSVICAGITSTGNFQNVVGVGSVGQVLTSAGAGALPTWNNAPGTGTINSGGINQLAFYAAAGTTLSGLATANDGLLVTGNTGIPSILAGPGTTGAILQSNSALAPSWSTATYPSTATGTGTILTANGTNWVATTATYPATTTINQILYSSAANVISGLSSAANGLLVTSATSVPSILAGPGTTGNILQSNAAAAPSFSTATYPSTATSTGTILRANGTNWVASTSTFADTYSINTILYNASANTVSGLATAASSILVTSAGGVPSWSTTIPAFTVSGNITFSPTTAGIVGTTTNNNAVAGNVGEYISSYINLPGSGITSGAVNNVTSISLTAGDWDVYFQLSTIPALNTVVGYTLVGIGTSTSTLLAQFGFSSLKSTYTGDGSSSTTLSGVARISLSATTTYYANVYASFTVSTCTAYGGLWARRIR